MATDLRIGRRLERVLDDGPLADEVGEAPAPVVEGPLGERVAQDLDGFGAVGHERRVVGEAGVGGELGPFDDLAHGRPVLAGLEAA